MGGERIRMPFSNEYCTFTPYTWLEVDSVLKPVLLKVVTEDLKSLGLRRNPNIMTFAIGEWTMLPIEEVEPGHWDWGGIWSARKLSGARTLSKYMADTYGRDTRIFLTLVENPVFANSYRVKSQGVCLLEELKK